MSCQLCVDCARVEGADSDAAISRDTFREFSGKHDISQLASAIGEPGVVPGGRERESYQCRNY